MPKPRTTLRYLALLALAALVFNWKTLLTNQYTIILGSEGVYQTYGWLHSWVSSLWKFQIGFWDPYSFGGRPYTNEMTEFYPLRLLFALFPFNRNEVISPHLYHDYMALTRYLASVFMFGLLRELKRSHFAALIGACAFSMGGMIVDLMWPQYVESCIWLPAVLFFIFRALRAETQLSRLVEGALAGICMGMSILAGGIQFAMMQGIIGMSALIYFGVVSRASRERWIQLGAILAIFLIAGAGFGAAQLIPSFEFGRHSIRFIDGGSFPMSAKIPYNRLNPGMWPQSIMTAIFPTAFFAKLGGGETWRIYIGVLPLFFALAAIWRCRANIWVRYLAALAAIAFAYSLGEFSPLHGIIYAITPYLWMIRQPSRFLYLVSFAMAILAAFGFDSLPGGSEDNQLSWQPARPFLKWASIVCTASLVLPAIFGQLTPAIWTSLSLLLILAACGFFFRLTQRPSSPALRFAIVAFMIFDMGAFNWLPVNKAELAKTGDVYEQMITLRPPSDFLRAHAGLNRVRAEVNPEPALGDIFGLQFLWGNGASWLTAYGELRPYEPLMNVRYRIKPAATADPGAIYQDPYWKVYEDPTAFPRAWVVHQTIAEPSDDAVYKRMGQRDIDMRKIAFLTSSLPEALDVAGDDTVAFRSYAADCMAMDVNTAGRGLLVLSEFEYPGWKASVNGQPQTIHRVDGGLRGIIVPRGRSRVELAYVPISFYAGIALSLMTALSTLAGWIFVRRKN